MIISFPFIFVERILIFFLDHPCSFVREKVNLSIELQHLQRIQTKKESESIEMIPHRSYFDLSGSGSSLEMTTDSIVGASNISSSKSMTEKSASKSHSEAERRRRERINGHLATLRTLLPNTIKTDKASLLAEVVQHVKELKNKVANGAKDGDGSYDGGGGREVEQYWPFPGETDELTLGYCDGSETHEGSSSSSSSSGKTVLIRVTLSCEDRPELLSDMMRALRSVRARVVRAEMATVGGRTKSVLMIQFQRRCSCSSSGDDDELGTLRRALKAILDKPAVSAKGQVLLSGNKRPRFISHPLNYY